MGMSLLQERVCTYLMNNADSPGYSAVLRKFAEGAPDEIVEFLLALAEGENNSELMETLAGVISSRERQKEGVDIQRQILRELQVQRQQLEFISSIMTLSLQNMGFQLAPEDKNTGVPEKESAGVPPVPRPPKGYSPFRG